MYDCSLPFHKKAKSASPYKTKSVLRVNNGGCIYGDKSVSVKNDGVVDFYSSLNPINQVMEFGS